MCEECSAENDDEYDGDSIAEKRRKAIRSVVRRHPELGVDPDEVTFRFAPKAEKKCIRVDSGGQSPRYEIHAPSYAAQAMSGSPSLSAIAMVVWIATDQSHADIAEVLGISPQMRHGAFFVSDEPPVNPARVEQEGAVQSYEMDVRDSRE